jgi:redox-sensitive bicupin YhaK (pirin superfamily)
MYVAQCEEGKSISLPLTSNRQLYVLQLEGSMEVSTINGNETLQQHDGARIKSGLTAPDQEQQVKFTCSGGPAHVLVVEMKETKD